MRFARLTFLLALFITAVSADSAKLNGLDDFIATALKDWQVPGAAVVVVQDGQVILSKGYGWRDMEKKLPVTTRTVFAIGSATKSFTVTTLGILVDRGKLAWDQPVRNYLPTFRMYDQFATERMTPRDLVTHRSGLPKHDMAWYNSSATRQELFDRLRYLEPSRDFRTRFQYQNLMFMTAGYLAGQIAGKPWEQFAREEILTPLNMTSSSFSINDSQKAGDLALPYIKVKEQVRRVPFRNIDSIAPAGSINSNIEDMAKYLMMQMNLGKSGDRQILSAGNATQMQMPQMVIPGTIRWSELGHEAYGMGFFITSYRGHKLVYHPGNIDGFSALLAFLPEDKIGLVILTNRTINMAPTVLSYNIYDRLLGLDLAPWTARFKEIERKQNEAQAAEDAEAAKKGFTGKPNTHPSHALTAYTGEFANPGYGSAKIALVNGELKISFNGFGSSLKHYHYDVFATDDNPYDLFETPDDSKGFPETKLSFHTNEDGDIDSFSVPLQPSVHDIVFTRPPAR